jgi:hypothetical protein
MATLMAVPTKEGLDILNSELSKKATRFCLIGSTSYTNNTLDSLLTRDNLVYSNVDKYVFFLEDIESQYFDENGVLTFQVIVPVETDFKHYMYAVAIITEDNELVVLTKTPKIVPIEGVGGTFVVKTAVKGEVSQMVFKKGEYITWNEAEALFMTPQMANLALMTTIGDKMIQDEIKQMEGV